MVLNISERKRPLTEYGIAIKVQLARMNKTQTWLIDEIKQLLPEAYIDTSNLYKIMTGSLRSERIEGAINNILGIETIPKN